MASPIKTLVVGHSFVKRAQSYAEVNNLDNINLPAAYHDVVLLGKGGAHIRDIIRMCETRVVKPDLVLLDIGTNDLESLKHPLTLAQDLVSVAKTILTQGTKRVVIMGALYRTIQGKHGAPDHFNARVRAFNSSLQQLIKSDNLPLAFWYHKGLSGKNKGYIIDGVHLNAEGIVKYIRSLRRAVMKFTPDL
jgi:lysophospholipase L1-like esterase